ncbi:hypothetical protein [Falsiroseomonas selenitidurans]|uniref:Surface antigen domain-containing protein n=1 Tax=Falsiroseomonas selenitidurans TaxID=2716335 RepID=A0ABX1DZQ5_9PROT|nr:hypothetical protein [Falsiroseomonas selenitidurans]NKC30369.1 hypothetical protein [Falsiroseomonas selenitidurans]
MRRLGLLGLAALGGCAQLPDVTGAVAGGGAALASSNPALGFAIGISVRAGVSAGLQVVMRRRQQAEQDAIAAAIGAPVPAAEGLPGAWAVRHGIPLGNREGEVRLVRVIDSALAECREALFRVQGEGQWFLTTACRQGEGWKWAAAEPATTRWGSLQ